jgi:hypothetical protein
VEAEGNESRSLGDAVVVIIVTRGHRPILSMLLFLLPFVFYIVNESRLAEEVFALVVRINTTGFLLDVLLIFYLLEEPKIDLAI